MTTSTTPEPLAPVTQTPIARRTVLAGAAWSVPAIALTTASPAFAASGTTLSFARSSYTGPGCSTINGVQVRASDNGTGQAGVSITTSLSGGFVFSNGGTSSTGVTGSDGSLTLPGITVPATGGTATASATASGASGSSTTLRGTDATVAKYLQNGTATDATGIPTGSIPAFAGCYLAPDGRILNSANNNNELASNVALIGELYRDQDNWVIPLRKSDGSCTYLVSGMYYSAWDERTANGVPSGSTPVSQVYFCTPDRRLVRGDDGSVGATDVDSWGQTYWNGSGRWRQPLKKTDGSFTIFHGSREPAAMGIPSGSTPAADAYFLTSDGRLVAGDTGAVLTTDVDNFGRMLWNGSNWRWPLKKKDGSFTYVQDGTEIVASGIPAGSTPISGAIFLAPDGRLIDSANSNSVYATSVSTTGQILFTDWNGHWQMPLGIAETTPSVLNSGAQQTPSGVPDNSKPTFAGVLLSPDGKLLNTTDSNKVLATDVVNFGQLYRDQDNWVFPLQKRDGTCTYLVSGMFFPGYEERSTSNVPAGSTPCFGGTFLANDGRLLNSDGTVLAPAVSSFGQVFWNGQHSWRIPLKKSDGTFTVLKDGSEVSTTGIPAGSTPAADAFFLTSDGRIIASDTGSVLATDVSSFGRMLWNGSNWRWPIKKTNGSYAYIENGTEVAVSGVPIGSTPVSGTLFLAPDGRVIDSANSNSVVATSVSTTGQILFTDWSGHWHMPLALKKSSC
ncbi:hypothetical protein [Microbacterium testaceum]|uniref:hypothetical protein n=1 Tax=Microbacterium testaceum TaxID=2033 RepID=UPI0012AD1020|nr:hypothetical protein [Microbacterium testaceum]